MITQETQVIIWLLMLIHCIGGCLSLLSNAFAVINSTNSQYLCLYTLDTAFTNSYATYGGAMYLDASDVVMYNCGITACSSLQVLL
jgi:hypothetical protein